MSPTKASRLLGERSGGRILRHGEEDSGGRAKERQWSRRRPGDCSAAGRAAGPFSTVKKTAKAQRRNDDETDEGLAIARREGGGRIFRHGEEASEGAAKERR